MRASVVAIHANAALLFKALHLSHPTGGLWVIQALYKAALSRGMNVIPAVQAGQVLAPWCRTLVLPSGWAKSEVGLDDPGGFFPTLIIQSHNHRMVLGWKGP